MRPSAFPCSPLSFLLIIFVFSSAVDAQAPPDTNLFQWKFSNNFLATGLPSCQTLDITVEPVNATNVTHGIPPFYMIAWEIGGTPRTVLLGLSESSLNWTVDHPVGTSLMLNVVDSQGNGGGIGPQPFTVTPGQTTECVVNGNSTTFTVTANVTGPINTCQPWGLRIKGGTPPYNLSLAQFNSPVVTNVTITSPSDAFTYINRATPQLGLLLAAISDVNGQYAFGTPTVMPTGSEDVDCIGLNSSPGITALLDEEQAAEAKAKRQRTATLAGVLTPLLFLLFGGAAFWGYRYYTKQQKMRLELKPEPMIFTEPKDVEEARGSLSESQVMSILDVHTSPSGPNSLLNPFLTEAERNLTVSPVDASDGHSNTTSSRPNSSSSRRGFSNFPVTSVRRPSKKAIEAGFATSASSQNPSPVATGSTSSIPPRRNPPIVERSQTAKVPTRPSSRVPSRSASLGAPVALPEGAPEFIIQHQDAGRFVRELPPPYKERRSRPTPDVPYSP